MDLLLRALESAPVLVSLAAVGISTSTHYRWLDQARRLEEDDLDEAGYREYAAAVDEARARGQLMRLEQLQPARWSDAGEEIVNWGDERVRAQNLRYLCDYYERSMSQREAADTRAAQAKAAKLELELEALKREHEWQWPKLDPVEVDPDQGLGTQALVELALREGEALWKARESAPPRFRTPITQALAYNAARLRILLGDGDTGKANRLVEIPPEVLEVEETVMVNYDRDITSE